jgi:hypothetical protein
MSEIYCSAPWNGITVRENGKVKTCCNGHVDLLDLNEQPISQLESSLPLQAIRQKMLSGIADETNCQGCLTQEHDNGMASLRSHYQTYYADISEPLQLKFLDVRWNNTCNLGCLYCSPTFSSTWVDRLQDVNRKIVPIHSYQDQLLDWVLEKSQHVQEIMLVGGEPMLMKQNYQLFKRLPKDCRISIITNLSYDLENLPCFQDLLDRPRQCINWNISAENLGDKLEYVRSGIKWSQVRHNLDTLQKHWPDQFGLNMVYNLFSAFDIDETVAQFMDFGIKKFVLQGVFHHRILQVSNLPLVLRSMAAQKLRQAIQCHRDRIHPEDRDFYYIRSAREIIARLEQESQDDVISLKEFTDGIQWYDQWGTNRFQDLWPQLLCDLKQHLE